METVINGIIEVTESYNLCPVCGLPSRTTSTVCPHHIIVWYDSKGKIIDHRDIEVCSELRIGRIAE